MSTGPKQLAGASSNDRQLGELLRRAADFLLVRKGRQTSGLHGQALSREEAGFGKRGTDRAGFSPAFEDFIRDQFLPWSEKEHSAHPRTHQRHIVSVRTLEAFFGKMRLDAITAAHGEIFKLVRGRQISPEGVNRDLATLRYLLNFAHRQGHLAENPISGVKPLRLGSGRVRLVSPDEQQRYLAAANPLLRDVAALILETGLRPEEVFAIRPADVGLGRRQLTVSARQTMFARREIPLTHAAGEVLQRRLTEARGDYLFPGHEDPSKSLARLRSAHRKALRKANIQPPFRLYDLRHTFGFRAAQAGMDLPTLRRRMGHSHVSMTLRYLRLKPQAQRNG